MQELLIATLNPGKFLEIKEAFSGVDYTLAFLGDLGVSDEGPLEDGVSFSENAYKKARFYFDKLGMLTLAEDSGIDVDALKGKLGVTTRRWGAGEKVSDSDWIDYFMKEMEGKEERGARFVCCACLLGEGVEAYFEGETKGTITRKLEAPLKRGIPLSSCFLPEGSEKVYAALSESEKNLISHRGKAMRKVRGFLTR